MHGAHIMAHTLEDKPYDPFLEANERAELDWKLVMASVLSLVPRPYQPQRGSLSVSCNTENDPCWGW